jgi:DNA/RNA endonuclease YhcR with UshA esterase domain
MSGRTPIRLVKLAAMALATVGLAILWLVATRAEVPTVAIGQAGATMNLAYVRVEGRCTRPPSYDLPTGYLSFWIADETGELYVASYRAESQALIDEGRVPALGDRVAVADTLRIREDFRSLTVNAADEVVITRAEPEPCVIGDIAPEQRYRRVRVRGQVRRVVEPYAGLTLVTIRDGTGSIEVALSDDLIALGGATPALEVGQSLEVAASVSQYEGTAQLVPASAVDVDPVDTGVPIAAKRFVAELSREDAGEWVAVRGTVVGFDPFSEGVKLTLDDGTGSVTVLLWQDVYERLRDELGDGRELSPGAEIEAQGEIAEYRSELEVIPELAADVRVLALPSPGAAATSDAATSIGSITGADVGRRVVLRGTLGPPEPFSAGVKYRLSDKSGAIILLLWSEVYRDIPSADELTFGAVVEVTGEIDQYRGDLEIIPRVDGVKLLER